MQHPVRGTSEQSRFLDERVYHEFAPESLWGPHINAIPPLKLPDWIHEGVAYVELWGQLGIPETVLPGRGHFVRPEGRRRAFGRWSDSCTCSARTHRGWHVNISDVTVVGAEALMTQLLRGELALLPLDS